MSVVSRVRNSITQRVIPRCRHMPRIARRCRRSRRSCSRSARPRV